MPKRIGAISAKRRSSEVPSPGPDIPQGQYAVKIVVDDPDPSKFQTGAQASAAIYTDEGNRSLGGAARIFDPGAFVVELALSDAILRQTRKGRLCLCPAFVAIFAAPVGRSLVSGCGRR
jgi:hypothetical protein